MKKLISVLLATLMLAGMLSGCTKQKSETPGGDEPSVTDPATAVRDDVTVGVSVSIAALNPMDSLARGEQDILRNVCEPLIKEENGDIIPVLCESYEISPDNMVATFKLRQDITFHNGEKFTAKDVKYTYDTISGAGGYQGEYYKGHGVTYDRTEIVDDYTVKIYAKQPTGGFLSMLTIIQMVNEKAVTDMGSAHKLAAVGTGPYKFVSYDKASNVNLTRFEEYWGDKPVIKDLNYRVIIDFQTLMVALESGEIDIASHVPPSLAIGLEGNDEFNVNWVPAEGNINLVFNCRAKPFDNSLIRQAVSYAIDRDAVNAIASEGKDIPYDVFMAPTMIAAPDDTKLFHYSYNKEKAKELLTEAGYPNGIKLDVPMEIMQGVEKYAIAVQQQLADVGIVFEIEILEQNTLFNKLFTSGFTFTVFSFSQEIKDVGNYARFMRSGVEGEIKIVNYSDPALDILIDEADAEPDIAKRRELYLVIYNEFQKQVPICPMLIKNVATVKTNKLNVTDQVGPIIEGKKLNWVS